MIAKLIRVCVKNRAMVLLLTALLVAVGVWSSFNITVDALPDLSDVQVVIRTEHTGQAPQIVEDQVTYPLTTAMLAVPHAKAVRGYSMFGTSFVYVIFEDGTDMYWARSRVLEQLNFVAGRLPRGVSPQLGPDATGVGWVYQYVLVTGKYCPDHPNGLWHDPQTNQWYAQLGDVPDDRRVSQRLERHRVFHDSRVIYADLENHRRYGRLDDAPANIRGRLKQIELARGFDRCPIDDKPLRRSDLDLSDLRGLQDWFFRFELTTVDGVSEVAPIGGFVKQYQVVVDPIKLLAHGISIARVKTAILRSNLDVGGRLIEASETEYMVRGLGYLGHLTEQEITEASAKGQRISALRSRRVLAQLGKIALSATEAGTPIYLADVAELRVGPEIRRGIAEWNGEGETVSGIVVIRFGENAQRTIEKIKTKLVELERGLPPGVGIEVGYDRSDLIQRSIHTIIATLREEIIVVALVIILFLMHPRSMLVAAFVLPTSVLATIAIMHLLGINANIMSFGGIAISIGVMVDSSIVMVENGHKHLEREKLRVARGEPPRPRARIIAVAAAEVGPTLFFSLVIIVISFLPIFVLSEQSGRLFKPLAYTKTFAMASAAILAVTIIPVLMTCFVSERIVPLHWRRSIRLLVYAAAMLLPAGLFVVMPMTNLDEYRWWIAGGWVVLIGLVMLPQKIYSETRNPLSILIRRLYEPVFIFVMHRRWSTLLVAMAMVAATAWPFSQLGREFMPPLEEGDLLYMPTTDPGISMTKARELLQQTDKIIKQFPEVQSVLGKAGRAETATDPAPPSMFETIITLRRDKSKWRRVRRSFDAWPVGTKWLGRSLLGVDRPITGDELVYGYNWPDGTRSPGMHDALKIPGLTNAWTMPIRARLDMLSTGIKTPVGVKIMGPDLGTLAELAGWVKTVVETDARTRRHTTSAFADKSVGGNYFDIEINRDEIARYGLNVADVQDVIMTATGGMSIDHTVEGLERYPINVRYPHELRDNVNSLRQMLVAIPTGAQVPLGQLARFNIHKGAPMIKSENARLTSWVYIDIAGIDVGTYVERARQAVAQSVSLPAGYSIAWAGQYEYMQAANRRLAIVIPLALVAIVLLLYLATRSWVQTIVVLVTVLFFAPVGSIWLLYLLDYNLSLAVWIGMIALAGLAAETGLVMLLYLENSVARFQAEGRMRNTNDLWLAIHDGAVQRIRPKTMTVTTTFIGLVPLMWASGAGADTMRRLAAPMIGGLATAFVLELLLYPVVFYMVKRIALMREFRRTPNEASPGDRPHGPVHG